MQLLDAVANQLKLRYKERHILFYMLKKQQAIYEEKTMKLKYATSPIFFFPTCLAVIFLIASVAVSAQVLQYNFEYKCNKERVVVGHCRRDSDQAGFPRTTDADNYCMVYYPDRPKQGGFEVQKVELRGDIIKILQACGAFAPAAPSLPNAPTATTKDESINGEITIAKSLVEKGLAFRKEKNETAALRQLDLAINKYKDIIARYPYASNPNVSNAYVGLGGIYMNHIQRYDLALPIWTKLRKLTPDDVSIAVLEGQTLYDLKRYDESIQALREVLASNLDSEFQAIAHLYLNYIYKDRKQYDKAAQEDLEAIKADPKNAGAYHSLGIAYYYLGEQAKAIDAFQKALWFNYSLPEQTYNWLGYIYIEQKMYDKALPFLNETFKNKPDYPTTSGNLGNAYSGLARYSDALSAYQRAAKLEPNNAQYLYNIGFAYMKLDKKAEAMQVYNSLKKMNAGKAQELLSEINK